MRPDRSPTATLSLLATLALAACSSISMPWHEDRPKVDDALLADLPDDDRQAIADLRAERARLGDELAAAEREISRREAQKDVADEELDVARQEVDVAKARLRAASEAGGEPDVVAELEDEGLAAARAHVAWARAQIDYGEALVQEARAERDLAKRRVELADARLEQRKAEAVTGLEGGRMTEADLERYAEAVDRAQVAVSMAEVDVDAWERKAAVNEERLPIHTEGVAKSRTASWNRVIEERE